MVLLTLCAGQFLMALDSSVMNVSIATVAEDLDTTVTGIQTAIVLYTLVMAMLMVTGGKIGSIIGRKRAFMIGLVIYCSGSLTTALAPNLAVLLFGWSLLEGIGAALIMPAIVALVAGNFPPEGRPRAYGLVGAAGAIAIAVGPLIGGLATTYASWRWVFAGEVLVGAGILLFAPPRRRRAGRGAPAPRPARLGALGAGHGARRSSGCCAPPSGGGSCRPRAAPSLLGHVAGRLADPRRARRDPAVHGCTSGASRRRAASRSSRPSLFAQPSDDRRAHDVLLPVRRDDGAVLRDPAVPVGRARALGDRHRASRSRRCRSRCCSRRRASRSSSRRPRPRRVVELGLVAVVIGIVVLFSAMDVDASAGDRDRPAAADRARAWAPSPRSSAASPSRRSPTSRAPRSAACRTRPRSSARRSAPRSPARS